MAGGLRRAVVFAMVLAAIALAPMLLRPKVSLFTWRSRTRIGSSQSGLCSDIGVRMLTEALRSNPEEHGLRPWSASEDDFIFPGLDDDLLQKVFRGRRIIFFGDSTLYFFFKWLHVLLVRTDSEVLSHLSSLSLSDGNKKVNPSGDMHLGLPLNGTATKISQSDGTHMSWIGYVGPSPLFICIHTGKWNLILRYRPEIVVANFGLHWLHFAAAGRNVQGCVAERWFKYEEWLEKAVQVSEKAGARILLFKTTNLVCADKYKGEYATANKLFVSGDRATLDACREKISSEVSAGMSNADIVDYCQNGTLNEVGSSRINERVERFVEWRKTSTNLTLGIFNDHDVESCEYTKEGDGRHYHSLNLLRIRLLGNILDCLGGVS